MKITIGKLRKIIRESVEEMHEMEQEEPIDADRVAYEGEPFECINCGFVYKYVGDENEWPTCPRCGAWQDEQIPFEENVKHTRTGKKGAKASARKQIRTKGKEGTVKNAKKWADNPWAYANWAKKQ